MHSRVRVTVVAVVALAVLATPMGALAAGDGPDLSVTADGTPIQEGDVYETGGDPTLTIEASVDDDAPAERTLTEVVVRVDGDRYRNVSVDGDSVTREVTLDLTTGNSTVRVIATDSADRANSTTFTVNKDDHPPWVSLTAPFESPPFRLISAAGERTSGSWTQFAGQFNDASKVDRIHIAYEWERDTDGDDVVDYRWTRMLRDVPHNFSQEIFLGVDGVNRITLTVTDEWGNTRIDEFTLNVTDRADPDIEFDPYPRRTTEGTVTLTGNVSDDVWIERATINVTQVDGTEEDTAKIFTPRDYQIIPERANHSFEKELRLEDVGTYEVNATVVDIRGNTTTETFRIERLPEEEFTVAPEIRIDRDRTVVLDSETLFVDGLVYDGQVERLVVETRNATSGRTVGYHLLYSGTNTRRIAFDRNVTILPGHTEVIVRATDANGKEHATSFFVNGSSKETFVGPLSGDEADDGTDTDGDTGNRTTPAVTVTPLQTGQPGVASASVRVAGATAGDSVRVPPRGGADAVAETTNVTFDRITLEMAADADFELSVATRDRSAGQLASPPGTVPAGATTITHSVADEQLSDVTLAFHVRRAYLEAHGIDPANLTVWRRSGGNWSERPTTRVGANETHVRYRASSPGLSTFTLAAGTLGNATADANETAGPANETAGPTNETAPNGTDATNGTESGNATDGGDDGGDGEDAGSPQIFVSNVTLNATDPSAGQPVAINATLANSGDAEGTYTAGLRVHEGLNVTLNGTKQVTVPPGERRNVTFVHRFNESGTYNVSINGTRAGPVAVGGGGLLSVFSVVPVRLIGMGVGGIVGLTVVGVLVRFVLRRVGGGGEGASG